MVARNMVQRFDTERGLDNTAGLPISQRIRRAIARYTWEYSMCFVDRSGPSKHQDSMQQLNDHSTLVGILTSPLLRS